MKRFRQIISFASSLLLLVCAFSACGSDDVRLKKPTEPPKTSADSGGDVTICPPASSHSHPWDDFDPYATIAESIKGSTVRYATWVDHTDSVGAVPLSNFYADTGLNVEIVNVPYSGYVDTMISKIASGDIPDVFISGGENSFPLTMQIAAPINRVSTVNLQEPIWDQSAINVGHIDGNVYLVNTIGSPWSRSTLLYFNETLFRENGIKTPEEYYEDGTWTWDSFERCALNIIALGDGYKAAYAERDHILNSCGYSLFEYDRKIATYSNGFDGKLMNAYSVYDDLQRQGLLNGDAKSFISGKCGMYIGTTDELMMTGLFKDMDPEDIGMTYLPSLQEGLESYIPSDQVMHGIVDGAPNSDAAGYFLRYWLDPDNYDLNKAAAYGFISNKAGNFYYEVTNTSSEQKLYDLDDAAAKLIGKDGKEYFWDQLDRVEADKKYGYYTESAVLSAVDKANELVRNKLEADRIKYY